MNTGKYLTFRWIVFFFTIISFNTSCSEEVQKSLSTVPIAFGTLNQLVVIADQQVWDGEVGDTLRYYYSSAFPILPQPEPIFDLKHFTPQDLLNEPMRKELRNYLFLANIADASSSTTIMVEKDLGTDKIRRAREEAKYNTSIGKDKWAKGQLLIYQLAFSQEELIENIKKNFSAISRKINEVQADKIDATVYLDGENLKLKREIKDLFGINMKIPKDYFLAINDGKIIWMRKELQDLSSNIIVHKVTYKSQKQLSKEGIKAIRDSIGRKYISSEIPNTYMRINDVDLPMFSNAKNLNNNYAIEARGIWEIVNDYMGGSFISYLIHNPKTNELIYVDGFLHAPGKTKREHMQQLEHILASTSF